MHSNFFEQISDAMKDTLICLPHAVSFSIQIKTDHLIRQVVEIQSLRLHSLWNFFFKHMIVFFMRLREYAAGLNVDIPGRVPLIKRPAAC